MMSVGVLVPCKPLTLGKSRLAGILSPLQRRELCSEFLTRTLDLARALVPASQITLISPDPDVRTIGHASAVEVVADSGGGLNAALSFARDLLLKRNALFGRLLVLPIDLPTAAAPSITSFLALEGDVVIAADAARSGTNLLGLSRHAVLGFKFCYGADSLTAHCSQALNKNLSVTIVENPCLAFDIDLPGDYWKWRDSEGLPTC